MDALNMLSGNIVRKEKKVSYKAQVWLYVDPRQQAHAQMATALIPLRVDGVPVRGCPWPHPLAGPGRRGSSRGARGNDVRTPRARPRFHGLATAVRAACLPLAAAALAGESCSLLHYLCESAANPDCTAFQPVVPERRPWRVPTRLRPATWHNGLIYSTLRALATKRMN